MISVVIPTFNESACLRNTLYGLFEAAIDPIEVIVVDGGRIDGSVDITTDFNVRLLQTEAGRSHQMNAGAAIATGDVFLFLHGDTQVPKGFDQMVLQTLYPSTAHPPIAGAFNLKIDSDRWPLRWVEWGVQIRSHWLQLPYGDQALFLKAETFHQMGGFPKLPIMEDFIFVRSLAKLGNIAIVPAAVTTSARRWEKQGILRTTLINQFMIVGYYSGISPDRLRTWYRSGLFGKRIS